MANFSEKRTKTRKSTREDLELLDKPELIDKILKLEAHNEQLKALLSKATNSNNLKEKATTEKIQKPFNFSRWYKRHILLKFYYLGWDYHGFTLQESSSNTIEDHLFAALIKSCLIESRESANYHRCGRTDKGVSAFSQVISLDIRSKLMPEKQSNVLKELPYCKMLNRLLPTNIRCIEWCPVPSNFSARFDCNYRKYRYFFPRGNLDINAMHEAVQYIIGDHDFRNICKMDVANGVTNFKRTITNAKVTKVTENDEITFTGYDICELQITSQAFLWHQIRCLMGILLLVGQKKEKPEIILQLLDIKAYPQKPQYNMAHEVPLILWKCDYKNVEWVTNKDELISIVKTLQQDWALNTIKSIMIKNMLSEIENIGSWTNSNFQSDCLLLGVRRKAYKPLMLRQMCDSLENKIRLHQDRKRKLEVSELDVM